MNREAFKALLRKHEGLRLEAYRDSVRGVCTIGYGHTGNDVREGMIISKAEAETLLDADAGSAVAHCRSAFGWFDSLCDARQLVIASMVFNMGLIGVERFKSMLAAIALKQWDAAADQMLQSLWANQVGARAKELAQMMRDGDEAAVA